MEFDFQTILNFVLGAIALFAGAFAGNVKLKLKQVVTLGKEFIQFSDKMNQYIEDDKVDKTEFTDLKAEWKDVKDNFAVVIGKKPAI